MKNTMDKAFYRTLKELDLIALELDNSVDSIERAQEIWSEAWETLAHQPHKRWTTALTRFEQAAWKRLTKEISIVYGKMEETRDAVEAFHELLDDRIEKLELQEETGRKRR